MQLDLSAVSDGSKCSSLPQRTAACRIWSTNNICQLQVRLLFCGYLGAIKGINSEWQIFDQFLAHWNIRDTHNWKYRNFSDGSFSNLHIDNFSWISVHNHIPTMSYFSTIQDYLGCSRLSLKSCEDHVALLWLQEVRLGAAFCPLLLSESSLAMLMLLKKDAPSQQVKVYWLWLWNLDAFECFT